MKKVVAVLLAGLMMLGLAACGAAASGTGAGSDSAQGSSGDQIKIAYIVKAKTDEFWTAMEKGAEEYAAEQGIEVDFQAPSKETDVEQQVNMVQNAVVKGYDAIILSAADSKSLIPAIVQANRDSGQ